MSGIDWIALSVPLSTVLGALIGGVVALRVNATSTQHGIADEFAKLSAAQAAGIANLRAEISRLRERVATLEREGESMQNRYTVLLEKYRRLRDWSAAVVEWDREGRKVPLPALPDV